jgi:outer membrane protein assembly factor BamB
MTRAPLTKGLSMKRRGLFAAAGLLLILAGCIPPAPVPPAPTIKGPDPAPVVLPQPPGSPSQATFGNGPGRNMVNLVDKTVPTEWSVAEGKTKNIKWVVDVGDRCYGGPTVHGGRVFVGTNNARPRDDKLKGKHLAVLMCFSAVDGKLLWQNTHEEPPEEVAREALTDGLCCTPTVVGELIYYCTPGAEVICASVKDGKIAWRYDMMKELKVFPCYVCNCSPLVVGDKVFVITGNGTDEQGKLNAPQAPSFVALHKDSGKLAWKSSLPGAKVIEGQWSNPAYAEVNGKGQVIFPGGDGYLYGLDPANGEMIWKFNCSPRPGPNDRGIQPYFVSTPVVYDNKVYIGVGAFPSHPAPPKVGHFFCVDITKKGDVSVRTRKGKDKDGKEIDLDVLDAKDPINKDSALVWHFGGMKDPKPAKGRPMYFERTISTAAIHDGLVYIAEERGYLNCLDAKTGERYWEHDFQTDVWGSAYWVAGKVMVCTDDGDCHIFEHGKKYQPPVKMEMEEPMQSTPVVADGVLYIATKSKVYAIAAGK